MNISSVRDIRNLKGYLQSLRIQTEIVVFTTTSYSQIYHYWRALHLLNCVVYPHQANHFPRVPPRLPAQSLSVLNWCGDPFIIPLVCNATYLELLAIVRVLLFLCIRSRHRRLACFCGSTVHLVDNQACLKEIFPFFVTCITTATSLRGRIFCL